MIPVRLFGFLALIPTAMLLTVSFFVLVVLRKVEEKGIKAFGYVVTSLLWLAALVVFSVGIYILSTGRHFCGYMMPGMMQFGQSQMMHSGAMPEMMPGQKPMMPCGKMNMSQDMPHSQEGTKK